MGQAQDLSAPSSLLLFVEQGQLQDQRGLQKQVERLDCSKQLLEVPNRCLHLDRCLQRQRGHSGSFIQFIQI